MTEKEKFEAFLALSVALTGFERLDLLGTGMANAYYETVADRAGTKVSDDLWAASSEILATIYKDDLSLEKALRINILSNPMFGPVARNTIKLWYLGQWDSLPGHWRSIYGNHFTDVDEIISGDAYKEGLVWTAIGAHPMGAKQPGYGTWSDPPPSAPDQD